MFLSFDDKKLTGEGLGKNNQITQQWVQWEKMILGWQKR